MNTEVQKVNLEVSEMPEIQSGELIVGLSSAIPGFIKKNLTHNAISFAPFYMRDHWIDLPIATIQELNPASNAFSLALKPGVNSEQILLDLIGALAQSKSGGLKLAKGNGNTEAKIAVLPQSGTEHGICRSCKRGDEFCVDCFLSI